MVLPEILLASNSPRRRELLSWMGLPFFTLPTSIDETPLKDEPPDQYVRRLAAEKSYAAARNSIGLIILAADTTVADGNLILGKPANRNEAADMLRQLRGRSHHVYTALSLKTKDHEQPLLDLCISPVTMRDYRDAELEVYISSGDPLDKAGAYAIQHEGFHPVTGFTHCYANVMGLPLCHLARTLSRAGIQPLVDIPTVCQNNLGYVCSVFQKFVV
jgi:septum formation protein